MPLSLLGAAHQHERHSNTRRPRNPIKRHITMSDAEWSMMDDESDFMVGNGDAVMSCGAATDTVVDFSCAVCDCVV